MQPPYQPSGNGPSAAAADYRYADPNERHPPCRRRTRGTIGDALDGKRVTWAWYSGAWAAALADGRQPPQQGA